VTKELILIKIVYACLGLTLLGLALTYFTPYSDIGSQFYMVTLTMGQLIAIFILLKNGSLIKSKYWGWMKAFIGLHLIGIVFKILHWGFADLIHLISLILIGITYTLHFIGKDKKHPLDVLKVAWVLVATIGGLLLHLLSRNLSTYPIEHVLFWLAFANFLFLKNQSKLISHS
jgi:hypothetical protein